MQEIRVQCPAKINLDLKITGKRPDGFHNIISTMQAVSLYDYLTISVENSNKTAVLLDGNSKEIPYDEKNIVYKAILEFLHSIQKQALVNVYINKNIPVSAGLAGGSTDAAGVILGLNEIYNKPLSNLQLHKLCASLGSDLNFCLEGGCKKATSRGEILTDADFVERKVSLIKPKHLGISAKEAYTKFGNKCNNIFYGRENFVNDLEWAIIGDYEELKLIKRLYPNSIMTGSGSTFFLINQEFKPMENYIVINNLSTINEGIKII